MFSKLHCILIWVLILPGAIEPCMATEEPSRSVLIKNIQIVTHEIFDNSNAKESSLFYRAANALHINSSERTIQNQLEFKVGDIVTLASIRETERVLRANRYLRDARIDIEEDSDGASLVIHTYDTWSTKIKVDYSTKGGDVKYEFGLKEENFLGQGIGLGLSFKKVLGLSYTVFKVSKDHIAGGDLRLDAQYADTNEGFIKDFSLSKPYRYFDNPNSYGVTLAYQELPKSLYFQSESYFDFFQLKRDFDVFYSVNNVVDNYSFKYTGGWHSTEMTHASIDDPLNIKNPALLAYSQSQDFLPNDINIQYPYLQFSVLQNTYTTRQNFEKIGSIEDHHLGFDTTFKLGYIYDTGDAESQQTYVSVNSAYAKEFGHDSLALASLTTQFRTDGKYLRNSRSELNLKYFKPQAPHFLFYSEYQLLNAHRLDGGEQLYLGEDREIRGYPARFISAEQIQRLTLEQRYYSHTQLWRIFNFGCALFFDYIHTTGGNDLEKEYNNTFQTVGIGFRLANNRSSISDTIHFDLSTPINPPDGVDRFQINISSQKHF